MKIGLVGKSGAPTKFLGLYLSGLVEKAGCMLSCLSQGGSTSALPHTFCHRPTRVSSGWLSRPPSGRWALSLTHRCWMEQPLGPGCFLKSCDTLYRQTVTCFQFPLERRSHQPSILEITHPREASILPVSLLQLLSFWWKIWWEGRWKEDLLLLLHPAPKHTNQKGLFFSSRNSIIYRPSWDMGKQRVAHAVSALGNFKPAMQLK